jgi:hypothetical protein
MAGRFIDGLPKQSPEASLMLVFFAFLREFVGVEMGAEGWGQESPG